MSKITIQECPLCGGKEFTPHLTCTDYYASGERFELWHCDACGFLFTQDAPSENEISRYYDTPDYISHSNTRKGVMNRVYHVARRFQLNRKAHLIERESGLRKGYLLDIGTGTGYFPATMQQRGWKVEAIEKSADAREFAAREFGLKVRPDGTLSSLDSRAFHVITLWHVMEHLNDLNKLWEELYRLLNENGVLIVAVPNHQSYDAARYEATWAAYDVPRHLWHFTPTTIRAWGEKHRFRLCESYPMPLDAFYVSMLSEKYQGKKHSFIRGGWAGSLAYLNALGNKERSSSLIYVFRKQTASY